MIDNSLLRRRISDKREGTISSIIDEMKGNRMVLPEFQRDYVWKLEDVRELLISIISGRIVGGLLAWETMIPLKSMSMTGAEVLDAYNNHYVYLLDGQQRMTSIYHAIVGDVYKKRDFSKILINLDSELVEDLIVLEDKDTDLERTIPFCDIFSEEGLAKHGEIISINDKVSLTLIANRVQDYNLSIFTLKTDNIIEAIEQFNALNTSGRKMSTYEIILSKIYSPKFKLKEEVIKLLQETAKFKLTDKVILDTLAFCISGSARTGEMILMEYDEVKVQWKSFVKAIKTTTDYLTRCGFHQMRELPYKNNFLVVTRLLFDEKITHLDSTQHNNVMRYILQTGLTKRYGSSSNVAMHNDYPKLRAIFDEPAHDEFQLDFIDNRFIQVNGNNGSMSFRKVVLWMLANEKPLSFKNNMEIKIDDASNSKRYCLNLHHIYPKNYLKNKKTKYPADHLVNLCHVESGINQKEISDKQPSVYLAEFAKHNPNIKYACNSLLFDYDVAVQDNYDKFFEARMNNMRLMIQKHFPEAV